MTAEGAADFIRAYRRANFQYNAALHWRWKQPTDPDPGVSSWEIGETLRLVKAHYTARWRAWLFQGNEIPEERRAAHADLVAALQAVEVGA